MSESIFIGQYVPKFVANTDKRVSQAGNNYSLKLMEMLEPKITISLFPIFIRNSDINSVNTQKYVRIYRKTKLPYKLHSIYRLLFDTFEAFTVVSKSKITDIFIYNVDKQNALLIWLIKNILRRKTYVIVADHWSYTNKSFMEKFSNSLLKKIDGTIVLNSNIKINSNQVVLPGLLLEKDIVFNDSGILNRNVLLSGSLGKTTGLLLALDCFSKNPNFNLYISGRPYKYSQDEFDKLINNYVNKYSNIHYLGLLDDDDYLKLFDLCDVCLSLRNSRDLEHQFNFPSKILEYLSKSKIVISSIEYTDIHEKLLFITEFDTKSLMSTVDEIYNLSEQNVREHKLLIYKYLLNNFCKKSLELACNKLTSYSKRLNEN